MATAVVREVLSHRTCRAALPNGKMIFAFATKGAAALELREGGELTVRISPGDFSLGEIVPPAR